MADKSNKEPLSISYEDYLNERMVDQMNWYDRKASLYKKRYRRLRTWEIVLGALIPFLLTFELEMLGLNVINLVVGAIGVSIVIIGGVMSLNKYQELYISYRQVSEQLKTEKFLFQTGSMPYNRDNRAKMFVRNVERILADENQSWVASQQQIQDVEDDDEPDGLAGAVYPGSSMGTSSAAADVAASPTVQPEAAPTLVWSPDEEEEAPSVLAEDDTPPNVFADDDAAEEEDDNNDKAPDVFA